MIATEGLAAADTRSPGFTVTLRDLEGGGRCLGPDGSRASEIADRCCPAAQPRYVAAPASLLALAKCR
jgi:hypothetical protein